MTRETWSSPYVLLLRAAVAAIAVGDQSDPAYPWRNRVQSIPSFRMRALNV